MATTTPNYGWPVPTSTDYVKDGATAIEALGDAIDATVFANTSAVIQVKNTVKTTAFTTTSATFVDVTGLSVSITPTSATNKILVFVTVSGIGADVSSAGETGFVIVRNSTQIGVNTDGASNFTGHLSKRNLSTGTAFSLNSAANVLDSPATTSATTYKIQVKGVGGGTTNINRDVDGNGTVSTITVMEVKP
jgi:hypothetical protein